MSYALDITPEAEARLARLIELLPPARRGAALDAVLTQLTTLAANPRLAVPAAVGRPVYRFSFVAEDTTYYWAATFRYSLDERAIVVTDVFRTQL
ncbi:MAG TPA: hypothetical protein VNJ71_05605 [Gemmatimonadales bacterium]|nr:hypothetical protein [Gemmatimonadales bacterium]